jgi:hypothetical protein
LGAADAVPVETLLLGGAVAVGGAGFAAATNPKGALWVLAELTGRAVVFARTAIGWASRFDASAVVTGLSGLAIAGTFALDVVGFAIAKTSDPPDTRPTCRAVWAVTAVHGISTCVHARALDAQQPLGTVAGVLTTLRLARFGTGLLCPLLVEAGVAFRAS